MYMYTDFANYQANPINILHSDRARYTCTAALINKNIPSVPNNHRTRISRYERQIIIISTRLSTSFVSR